MNQSRIALTVLVVLAAIAAAALGFWFTVGEAPSAARANLLVDGGLIVALAVLTSTVGKQRSGPLQNLADAMRGLALGNYQQRLEPEAFGDFEDLARAFNDVAARLSEDHDPALGEVKTAKRPRQERVLPRPTAPSRTKEQMPHPSPEVGEVRVMSRKKSVDVDESGQKNQAISRKETAVVQKKVDERVSPFEAPVTHHPTSGLEPIIRPEDDLDLDHVFPSMEGQLPIGLPTGDRPATSVQKPIEIVQHDTAIDEAAPEGAEATEPLSVDAEPYVKPPKKTPARGRKDFGLVFQDFVDAKHQAGDSVQDLDETAFVAMLVEEADRLCEEHKCRDVRFQVTIKGKDVSLLPRLLR